MNRAKPDGLPVITFKAAQVERRLPIAGGVGGPVGEEVDLRRPSPGLPVEHADHDERDAVDEGVAELVTNSVAGAGTPPCRGQVDAEVGVAGRWCCPGWSGR